MRGCIYVSVTVLQAISPSVKQGGRKKERERDKRKEENMTGA